MAKKEKTPATVSEEKENLSMVQTPAKDPNALAKISVHSVCGKVGKPAHTIDVMLVVGIIDKVFAKEKSDETIVKGFTGYFEASAFIGEKSGQTFYGTTLNLPTSAHDYVLSQLTVGKGNKVGGAEFAIKITAGPTGPGYELLSYPVTPDRKARISSLRNTL